jgi:adenylate cyclase
VRSKPLIAAAPSVKTDERITELHLWAVHEGLRRTPTATLFEDFCRRLVAAGVPLWRAFAGMRTLHPQWAGYTYTWWHDRNVVDPTRRKRGEVYEQDLRDSPYAQLREVAAGRDLPSRLRRRLIGSQAQRDFPFLEELANLGATDYVGELIPVGMVTEAFPDSGIGFSFATDCPEGFGENDLPLDPSPAACGGTCDYVGCRAHDCRWPARRLSRR